MTIQEINTITEKLNYYLDIAKLKSFLVDNSALDELFWFIDKLNEKTFNAYIDNDLIFLLKHIEILKDLTSKYNIILSKENIISEVTRESLFSYSTDSISMNEIQSIIKKIKLISEIDSISTNLYEKVINKNSKYQLRKEQIYNLIRLEGHKTRSRNYLDFVLLSMLNENLLIDDDILEIFNTITKKSKQLMEFETQSSDRIAAQLENFLIRYHDYVMIEKEIELLDNLAEIDINIHTILDSIKSLINNLADYQSLNVSYKIKEHFENNLKEIKNHQISAGTDIRYKTITESVKEHVAGLIGKHTNWQFPIVYFEPDDGEFTRNLISGEPFYVVDNKSFGHKNVLEQLHEAAKTKIHHYRLSDIDNIPDNSINLFFAWNKFTITNSNDIDKKFNIIDKKLMPGGICILNFNDIRIPVGADLSDEYKAYPLDLTEIKNYLKKYSLRIINSKSFNYTGYTVLLIKKDGEQPYLNLANKLGLVREKNNNKPQTTSENISQFSLDLERILSVTADDQIVFELRNAIKKNHVSQFNSEKLILNHYLKYFKILNDLIAKKSNDHPDVVITTIKLSKIAFLQNQLPESRQTMMRIKRAVNRSETINPDKKEKFFNWLNYLNNI